MELQTLGRGQSSYKPLKEEHLIRHADGRELSLVGYKTPLWKQVVHVVLCVITFGLWFLVRWNDWCSHLAIA